MRFIVHDDIPWNLSDGEWLPEELSKYGKVRRLGGDKFNFALMHWRPQSFLSMLVCPFVYFVQAVRLLLTADSENIVVTRSHGSGLLYNALCVLCHLNRKIVSFNWIDVPKKRYHLLASLALHNSNFIPIINAPLLKEQICKEYELSEWHGLCLPDVFDTKKEMKIPRYNRESYFFSGGINNRDWDLLLQCAEEMPDVSFRIVCNRHKWTNVDRNIPTNVQIFFDLDLETYNEMLSNAYAVVIPLRENRTSGLVNIIQAIQYGIPCITAAIEATKMYYPPKLNIQDELLYEIGNMKSLEGKIKKVHQYSETSYRERGEELQSYLQNNFSGEKNVARLVQYLQKYWWEQER